MSYSHYVNPFLSCKLKCTRSRPFPCHILFISFAHLPTDSCFHYFLLILITLAIKARTSKEKTEIDGEREKRKNDYGLAQSCQRIKAQLTIEHSRTNKIHSLILLNEMNFCIFCFPHTHSFLNGFIWK